MRGGVSLGVARVHVRPKLHQQPHRPGVALLGGVVQGCAPVVRLRVHVRAELHQRPHLPRKPRPRMDRGFGGMVTEGPAAHLVVACADVCCKSGLLPLSLPVACLEQVRVYSLDR